MIESNLDELSQVAQTALLQSLHTQAGVEAALDNGTIFVNLSGSSDGSESIVVRVLEVAPTEGGVVAQVGVRVGSAWISEEGIIDVIAGIERAPYLAARSAIDKWMRYTFPPIHAAFVQDEQPVPGVGITQLVARGDAQWQILSTNPLLIGAPQDQIALDTALREKTLFPGYVGDPLAERLSDEAGGLHWLKLLVASAGGRLIAETQFDNHEWDDLDNLLKSEFRFPSLAGGFLSMSQFLVIRPA